MASYDYECPKCNHAELISKSISEYNKPEHCPECKSEMRRLISPGYFYGEKVEEAYFNHGLGEVVRNSKHAREIARQKDLIEVGNEKVPHNPVSIPYEMKRKVYELRRK